MATESVAVTTRARKGLHAVESQIVLDDVLALIPPGTYQAVGRRGRLLRIFQTDKLLVPFDVLVPDGTAEYGHRRVRTFRAYNVTRTSAGHFVAGRASDFLREAAIALDRPVQRRERPGAAVFKGVMFRVEVRTVMQDHRQHRLHEHNRYSVVDRVLERLAGGPTT